MKTVIDFLKLLPDTAPNFDGEKIFNTKATYIKKIKSIDGGLLPQNHKKQKNNIYNKRTFNYL
jgi:hypothetical protein